MKGDERVEGVKLEARAVLGTAFGTAAAVPVLTGERVAVGERADIGCVLLTGAAGDLRAAGTAVGVALPTVPGRVHSVDGRMAVWLSPRSWLVRCPIEEEGDVVRQVNSAYPDKLLHAVRYTDALCWLELSGFGAFGLLSAGGFVSLEQAGLAIGYAKRTLVAQVAVLVVREAETVWVVGVERSRARYFMDWLRAAAE